MSGVDRSGVAAEAPELGFEAHPLVESLYASLPDSIEGKFYSAADWQRVRLELWYLNELLMAGKTPGAMAWSAMQTAMSALLISPADKRRVGIELQRRKVDADEDAAVAQIDEYRRRLGS
jgi:hypothetical protein